MLGVAELARGTVFDRPWGKTLAAVGLRGITGQITVTDGDKTYCVAFHHGAIVGAHSPLASDSAVRLALTSTLINSTHAAEIARRLTSAPASDEVLLVSEVGKLSPEHALKLRRRTIAQHTTRTFALEYGNFVLSEEITIPCFPEASVDTRAIIYMAARTAITEIRLETDFEQFPFSMKLTAETVPLLAQYGFTESERGLLEILNAGSSTLAELESARTGVEPRTLRAVIYALACTGAFEPSSVGRPTARNSRSAPGLVAKPSVVPTGPIVERHSQHSNPEQMAARAAARLSTSPVPPASAQPAQPTQPTPAQPAPTEAPAKHTVTPQTPLLPVLQVGSQTAVHRNSAQGTAPPNTNPPPVPPQSALAAVRGTGAIQTVSGNFAPIAGADRSPALIAAITALIKERLHILDRGADHFVLLGVNEQSPPDQIRTAYFALARQLHPDRLASAGVVELKRDSQRLFAQINTAFAVLTNPEKRLAYVQILRQGGEAVVRARQAEAEALTLRILAAEDAYHRGEMALRRSNFDAAIADFNEAIAANATEGDYHASLAWATFCGANDKAVVEKASRDGFIKALQLSPRSVTALLYWGRMERMMGHANVAREKFELILAKEPHHTEASSELRVLDARGGTRTDDKPDKSKPGLFGLFKK